MLAKNQEKSFCPKQINHFLLLMLREMTMSSLQNFIKPFIMEIILGLVNTIPNSFNPKKTNIDFSLEERIVTFIIVKKPVFPGPSYYCMNNNLFGNFKLINSKFPKTPIPSLKEKGKRFIYRIII